MKIIRWGKDKSLFRLGQRERHLLLAVLNRYPLVPSAHQPITRTAALRDSDSTQRLLNEALAEQRADNRKQLQALLADPQRFKKTKAGWSLSLSRSDIEWLLQILNDIRVGSWIILGSPDQGKELAMLNAKTAPHFWAMETSGHFQMQLLEALGGQRDA
jgi:hypothetical protein